MWHRVAIALPILLAPLALTPADPNEPSAVQAEHYTIDPVHSTVVFRIKHLGVSYFYGRFNRMAGQFTFDEKNPSRCSIEVQIKADSVDTHDESRDNHIRSEQFLHVEKFPVIKFKSRKITRSGDRKYKVEGDFTLHGVTRPLTLEVEHVGSGKDPWGGYRTGFDMSFTIKRTDFGMDFLLNGLGDEIRIFLGIEGKRDALR